MRIRILGEWFLRFLFRDFQDFCFFLALLNGGKIGIIGWFCGFSGVCGGIYIKVPHKPRELGLKILLFIRYTKSGQY